MKLIVIFNDGVPNLEIREKIQNKINEFHKDNLVLFGSDIEVLLMPSEPRKTFQERMREELAKKTP